MFGKPGRVSNQGLGRKKCGFRVTSDITSIEFGERTSKVENGALKPPPKNKENKRFYSRIPLCSISAITNFRN